MTTISLTDPVNGTTADANVIAANNALIENVLNGGVDSSNVTDASLTPADIATGTFLQLVTGGTARKIGFGSQVMTFPGGTAVGGVVAAAHGLGVVPLAIIATAGITNGGFAVATYINGSDATNITVGGYAQGGNPPGGNTSTIYWLAIG